MTEATVNLCLRAARAAARVERGLRGVRPRDWKKRFRRLLRPSQERFTELRPSGIKDAPPVRVVVTESHLSLAGRLRMQAMRAL
jgi:hypothetical protein